MLSLSPMYGKARGINIFDEVQKVLSKASVPITKLSGVATNGMPSMFIKLIVNIVNFIRAKEINYREFKPVLKELDSEYGDVLNFTVVRWLSRGAVLKRV
ncbi:general transcription factor II-I repeat domain-containing protein 2-like [Oopsacas minuta]|uniref:General transcription factor II-I repeat domain-containing protein 2-like n=1 Tax=Oopsacas minuta TaxID=111878 RepID=A0AAV7KH69_9METZ|nr:general transcription factor II-I repeat domain-containing protein 2-like [Oopsacas minuta]